MSAPAIRLTWHLLFAIFGGIAATASGLYGMGFLNAPATAQELARVKSIGLKNQALVTGAIQELSMLKTDMAVEKQARSEIDNRLSKIESDQSEIRADQKSIKNDISQILRLMISRSPQR